MNCFIFSWEVTFCGTSTRQEIAKAKLWLSTKTLSQMFLVWLSVLVALRYQAEPSKRWQLGLCSLHLTTQGRTAATFSFKARSWFPGMGHVRTRWNCWRSWIIKPKLSYLLMTVTVTHFSKLTLAYIWLICLVFFVLFGEEIKWLWEAKSGKQKNDNLRKKKELCCLTNKSTWKNTTKQTLGWEIMPSRKATWPQKAFPALESPNSILCQYYSA